MANPNRQNQGTTEPQAEGTKPEPKRNPFSLLYGAPSFEASKPKEPFIFKDGVDKGTAQTALAEVSFPRYGESLGIEGATRANHRIVMRKATDGKITLHFNAPTISVGPVRHPVLNLKNASEPTQRAYADWQNEIVNGFMIWRKDQKATGKALSPAMAVGGSREVSPDDMTALGLN